MPGGISGPRGAIRPKLHAMRVIGLMSGTSADAVDAALVEWPGDAAAQPFVLLGYRELPLPRSERSRIHALAAGELAGEEAMAELVALDRVLGERFAEAAQAVAKDAGAALEDVDAIASHGQTIAHHPELGGSLQIGSLAVIAERTGRPVVGDFRAGDLAAGGQGAPLAPFFHHAAFAAESEGRLALNLGGIANVTWLPAGGDAEAVMAFDVGPANSLVDGVVELMSEGAESMDRDGARADRGAVCPELLERLLADEYLALAPPKSTGRERYGRARAATILADWRPREGDPRHDDLVATLVAFTARSVAQACGRWLPGWSGSGERVLVGGGGAANPAMMRALKDEFSGVAVEPFDAWGVPAGAAEAMAFSLMGRNAVLGLVNHLPRCTGAARPSVLGSRVGGL